MNIIDKDVCTIGSQTRIIGVGGDTNAPWT